MNLRKKELILKLCWVFGVYTVDLGEYFTKMSFHQKRDKSACGPEFA
jgi:hypothetical protein